MVFRRLRRTISENSLQVYTTDRSNRIVLVKEILSACLIIEKYFAKTLYEASLLTAVTFSLRS